MRYYFDLREGDRVIADEEGMELVGLQRVQEEAARSLADMARDRTLEHARDGVSHELAIECATKMVQCLRRASLCR